MVLAGHFPRDVKVKQSTGGEWIPLSDELGEHSTSKLQKSCIPDSKTVLTWIFSMTAVGGVIALLGAIVMSAAVKKQISKPTATLSATSTPAPIRAKPSPTPKTSASSSSSYAASAPIVLPPAKPVVRTAVAASTPSLPVATPPPSSLYTDARGQTYRVSNSDYRRLQQMKVGLESEEKLVEQQQASLDALDSEISAARRNVNRSSQTSVNRFNARIGDYNTQLENTQAAIDRFNRRVDEFNTELQRVGTPIR